jgi:glucose/arabinose dehydrogenase
MHTGGMRPTRGPAAVAGLVSVALVLVAGCGVPDALRAEPTWVPKPEGPPPAELPQPDLPGQPRSPGGPGQPAPPANPGGVDDPAVVATGLRLPWGLVVTPEGHALVGERTTGRILRVQPRRSPVREVMRITGLDTGGDGGLLGLALSPSYADDGLVFAYLTTPTDNRVVRFEIGGRPTPVLTGIPRGRVHNGGRIAFGPDGMLYVGTGDTGRPALAADPRSLAGKVLRVTAFGRPAEGNPQPGSAVYSRGHRNVAGLCLNPGGRLYATEPGSAADEINTVEAGGDYGWPPAAGRSGQRAPALTLPSATATLGGCAVLERGLFTAAVRGARLWAVPLDANGRVGRARAVLANVYGRLRTVVAAPDGALWLTTSNRDGAGRPMAADDRVIRILPPAGTTNSPV